MEIRVNVVLLGALALAWAALTSVDPVAAMNPRSPSTQRLAELEDELAMDKGNVQVARELVDQYLLLDRPGLAIAALRSTDPAMTEDPVIAHRLAQAYESSGRIDDALSTARLALARCARSLGAATAVTPVPRFACSERQYAILDVHAQALEHMARWGVLEPRTDARAGIAYDLALRRARVASH